MAPRRVPQSQGSIVLAVLAYAERGGVSMGGLFLVALGIYGGQYATLFPENTRSYAAAFCLLVSACGLVAVVYQLNKRDLPNVATVEEMTSYLGATPESVVEASATVMWVMNFTLL